MCNTEIYFTEEMSSLKIEARHLNPSTEFKRMFGSKVVNTSTEFRYILFKYKKNTVYLILIAKLKIFSFIFIIEEKLVEDL